MDIRASINLVESASNSQEIFWFWFNPATKQLIHCEGTHTTSAVYDLEIWPEDRDPNESDLSSEDDEILRLATAKGWVRGRYGKQVPSSRNPEKMIWDMSSQHGGDAGLDLSLQGLPRNVARTATYMRDKMNISFSVLYVDFDGGYQMEGHRLEGRRLEIFLKTASIPSASVQEDR